MIFFSNKLILDLFIPPESREPSQESTIQSQPIFSFGNNKKSSESQPEEQNRSQKTSAVNPRIEFREKSDHQSSEKTPGGSNQVTTAQSQLPNNQNQNRKRKVLINKLLKFYKIATQTPQPNLYSKAPSSTTEFLLKLQNDTWKFLLMSHTSQGRPFKHLQLFYKSFLKVTNQSFQQVKTVLQRHQLL